MKMNEILYLIFWLFVGLLINHHIINEGPKIDINIGRAFDPVVYALSVTDLSMDRNDSKDSGGQEEGGESNEA